jgi:site-specific recombinase XerD
MTALAPTLQSFFTHYLIGQRDASRHTISAYRDMFRLLLGYIHDCTGTKPNDLNFLDVNAQVVANFLTMLENERGNSARTRNARLAAIYSFFYYAALRHPEHADVIARVLAIARKNTQSMLMTYLNEDEVEALLADLERATWTGRRDHLMILMLITTGLRVSELTSLTHSNTHPHAPGARIACHGKGRKDRITPLETGTANELRTWFRENPAPATAPIFTVNGADRPMSTDAVAQRITLYSLAAAATCLSLATRKINYPTSCGEHAHRGCVPHDVGCYFSGAPMPPCERSLDVMDFPPLTNRMDL